MAEELLRKARAEFDELDPYSGSFLRQMVERRQLGDVVEDYQHRENH
jgi:hypothetical protein